MRLLNGTVDSRKKPSAALAVNSGHLYSNTRYVGNCNRPTVPAARSLLDAALQDVLQICALLGLGDTARILVLEPFSAAFACRLRAAGFTGECWALVQHISPALQSCTEPAYDRVIEADWPAAVGIRERHSPQVDMDQFDVVVCLELSRIFAQERVLNALEWVSSTLLSSYGYLLSGEPLAFSPLCAMEQRLLQSGLLLVADERVIEADWTWGVTRWQFRPGDSSRLTGQIHAVTHADLDQYPELRPSIVSCYQEAFGGDEWHEWMRCPECYRYYSSSEYDALRPAAHCVCGTSRPLEPYHKPQAILAELYEDLADSANSRLYVRTGSEDSVDAFIWGSLITAEQAASQLFLHYGADEQKRLQWALTDLLHRQGMYDPSARIFYMAYLGAREQFRSLSLVRSLFTRLCQFAVDRGVEVVIGATIPSVNTYTLLCGIGMEPVYSYPKPPSRTQNSRLDETGVIIAGTARSMLSKVSCSERRLALHIGRSIKLRGAPGQAPARTAW